MFIRFTNVTTKFRVYVVVNKSKLKINVHCRRFDDFDNSVNIFQQLFFASNVIYRISFLFDNNHCYKFKFFKTFMQRLYSFFYVVTQLYQFFLIFDKNDNVLNQNNTSKTRVKILLNQFDIFYICYIFNAIDKIRYVTKINVLVDVYNKFINDNRFIIIHKIKKVNFICISFIVIIVVDIF